MTTPKYEFLRGSFSEISNSLARFTSFGGVGRDCRFRATDSSRAVEYFTKLPCTLRGVFEHSLNLLLTSLIVFDSDHAQVLFLFECHFPKYSIALPESLVLTLRGRTDLSELLILTGLSNISQNYSAFYVVYLNIH